VIVHHHLGDQAADVRRDADHIGEDVAVARPGGRLVSIPQPERDDESGQHEERRDRPAHESWEQKSHGRSPQPCVTQTMAASRSKKSEISVTGRVATSRWTPMSERSRESIAGSITAAQAKSSNDGT